MQRSLKRILEIFIRKIYIQNRDNYTNMFDILKQKKGRGRKRRGVERRPGRVKTGIEIDKWIEEKLKGEEPEWVRTGIPGFDDLIEEGGIPRGINVLVSGGPGTGKTIFCLQTLYNAARFGHKCVYITYEESPERLKDHMRRFGWDIDALEKEGLLTLKRMDPFSVARSVEALLAKAAGILPIEIEEIPKLIPDGSNPYMIALDSLSALESAFAGKPESYRIYVEQLFRLFEKTGATTFLITETEEAPKKFSKTGVEEYLADGVFVLYYTKIRDVRMRAIEILKLRGAKHQNKLVPLHITDEGIEVSSGERVYLE